MVVFTNYLHTSCNGAKAVAVMAGVDQDRLVESGPLAVDSVAVDDLGQQLMRFVLTVKRGATNFAGHNKDGIEYPAYGLLAHLIVDGPRRTTALADAVHSDPSTVSRQTAALVRHGLLERRPDPIDGRASILAATPEGERVFLDNRRRHNENMASLLSNWSEQEIHQLAVLLTRLNTDFEAHHRARELTGEFAHNSMEGRDT
jgi:DNA-binding MarR family transcriptional regulator